MPSEKVYFVLLFGLALATRGIGQNLVFMLPSVTVE